ncbi:hypothetical protein STENM327S_07560 [Streptomyces tendae]
MLNRESTKSRANLRTGPLSRAGRYRSSPFASASRWRAIAVRRSSRCRLAASLRVIGVLATLRRWDWAALRLGVGLPFGACGSRGCLESVTGALTALWAFSSLARLRNTKPKGTGCRGVDPSPVGNDPATPVVCKWTERMLQSGWCVQPRTPGLSGQPGSTYSLRRDGERTQSSLGMSASVPEQCGNGCRARTVGSVAVAGAGVGQKGAREAHERCHEAYGDDLPREGQQGPYWAEDPRETLDYSYQKQLKLLQKVRRGVADVATSRKRLELQLNQLQSQSGKLEDQGRKALALGREDLAREALSRRAALQQQVTDLETQHATLQGEEEKLTLAAQRLQAKVDAFRTKKQTIKATYTAAQAQTRIGEAFSGISEEMGDVGLAIQRAEDKTAQLQARAGAIDELLASGALDDQSGMHKDDIQAELDRLSGGTDVELGTAAHEGRAGRGLHRRPPGHRGRPGTGPGPVAVAAAAAGHPALRQAVAPRLGGPT